MKVYEYKSQFGWPEDNGIGERLIQQIIQGKKTTTAGPKALYSFCELAVIYDSVDKPATVIDKDGQPRCNIQILDVFETTFSAPDPRLIAGEGYGDDAEAFRKSHREAWRDLVETGKLVLDDNTVLVVEVFRFLEEWWIGGGIPENLV